MRAEIYHKELYTPAVASLRSGFLFSVVDTFAKLGLDTKKTKLGAMQFHPVTKSERDRSFLRTPPPQGHAVLDRGYPFNAEPGNLDP